MYETREEYERVVAIQLRILETLIGYSIHHGDRGNCPRCGTEGMFDVAGPGFDPYMDNSIYYSTVFYHWRCRACDFRMCS